MKELLSELRRNGIILNVAGEELSVKFPKGKMDERLLEKIKVGKAELISYLKKLNQYEYSDIPVVQDLQPDYVLSSSQLRLWILSRMEGSNEAYNIPVVYEFSGQVDPEGLEWSFRQLIGRHEILRTVFHENEQGEARQVVLNSEDAGFSLSCIDMRSADEDQVSEAIRSEFTHRFDLGKGPLLRATLLQVAVDKWLFIYVAHHIISDGWSMGVLVSEVLLHYNNYMKGEKSALSPLRIQYRDYAGWQQQQLKRPEMEAHREYWLKQFEGFSPDLEMPSDRIRPAVRSYKGGSVSVQVNKEVSDLLKELGRRHEATLFMSVLAAVNILLYRYTGQKDIVIGSPIAGRDHADLEEQLGFYVNTLALRTVLEGNESYLEVLEKVRQLTLQAYDHQSYPFDELVNDLGLHSDRGRHPLFDVMVVLQNTGNYQTAYGQDGGGFVINKYEGGDSVISKFDLSFHFMEAEHGLEATVEYNSDIYDEQTAHRIGSHLQELLKSIVSQPQELVNELDYVCTEEKKQLLEEFNDRSLVYDKKQTVLRLFEKQVKQTPLAPAVEYGAARLNYISLDEQSNQFCNYLQQQYAIKAGGLIGIKAPRSEKLLIALLGIMKCGCAYVPIDPVYPQERIDYMLSDSGCRLLVDERVLEEFGNCQAEMKKTLTGRRPRSAGLAYVIYTSGSTGIPKGCAVTQENLSYYIQWANSYYWPDEKASFGLFTSLSFDLTVTSIFCTLTQGGCLYVYEQDQDVAAILVDQFTNKNKAINSIKLTPSHIGLLKQLNIESTDVRCAIVGGEAVLGVHVGTLKQISSEIKVRNEYGPTETTVGCVVKELQQEEKILIGRPIRGTGIYIVDEARGLCGIGIPGEICISGPGVSKGYLNKAALTAEKFISNPYSPGERMYRTGDAGKWTSDGNIEYLGRKDDQVKIRGYRIEPGEIESVLQRHAQVASAIVSAKEDGVGEKQLVAYVVMKENEVMDATELRNLLAASLPSYMVPSFFVQLQEIPLSANGKIDKKRLPDPSGTTLTYIAPRNFTEEKLVMIWAEVLSIDKAQISVTDNFFELGGHSLKATRLAGQIYKIFEIKIELKDLFTNMVLENQARVIEQARKTSYLSIPVIEAQPDYALSASQRRLWVLCQFEQANVAYNMPAAYVFKGDLNINALTRSFNALLHRHESLRTVFKENENGEIRQFITDGWQTGFSIGYHDLRQEPEQKEILKRSVDKDFITPFDLSAGPLLRANVYQVAGDQWILTYVLHHIISDGWSIELLIKEMLALYDSFLRDEDNPLKPLNIQYKDYSAWQLEQLSGESLQIHRQYWLDQFSGELPVLDLSVDKVRPAIKTYNGASVSKEFNVEITKGLEALCQQQKCTMFMGLLAAANALFYRYTGREDIVIGTPMAGRDHADLEEQIGFYVNTLALRVKFSGNNSYNELLENVKQVTLHGHEHQLYPFDKLVDELQLQRDMSRHPLFDVQVIVQNTQNNIKNGKYDPENLSVEHYNDAETLRSVFDMVLNFSETGWGLYAYITYNRDVYSESEVRRMIDHLENLLGNIVRYPGMPVRQLEFLNENEKHELLSIFNAASAEYPQDKTLVDLFVEKVELYADQPAVWYEQSSLSYRELDEQSSRLAAYLSAEYQVKNGGLVGVMLDRSDKLIIAILAILKAGAAYVPVDPGYPRLRKEFMISDTGMQVLVTESQYLFDLDYYKGNVFAIDVQLDGIAAEKPFETVISPDDLAYVIYTSGSTGEPKGVMIGHHGIVNTVYAQQEIFSAVAGDHHLQFASGSFDASVSEIFVCLCSGGTLYIIREEQKKDPLQLEQYIRDNQIDILTLPPAYLAMMKDEALQGIKTLVTAGEKARRADAQRALCYGNYVNAYGPTETSICATAYKVIKGGKIHTDNVPIGRPVNNAEIYILDDQLNLLPAGMAGEICIGGRGLARGYLNRSELTAEKFVDHPFRQGEKIYRSGDTGRWLKDGNIEYAGRKDEQVKVRGYRIEPGEIERLLQNREDIRSVVVTVRGAGDEKELVAYIVSEENIAVTELRSYLGATLPSYMIPSHFVQLEAIPLNRSGKVDKKSLPDPLTAGMQTAISDGPPRTETERQLIEVYEEVLKRPAGAGSDFFVLGGDSIKSIQVVSRLKQRGYSLTIQDVLLHPVVEELALHVKAVGRVAEQGQLSGEVPLGPVQRFFFQRHDQNNHHYNQSVLLNSGERLSGPALKKSLEELLLHHDALRMVYEKDESGNWKQLVSAEQKGCWLETLDIDAEDPSFNNYCDSLQSGFDLTKGPLFKAALLRGKDIDRLLLVAHHLIIDGVSWRILFEDLCTLYGQYAAGQAKQLPLKTDSLRYWQQKLQEYAQSENLRQQENYWSHIESVQAKALPLDNEQGGNLIKDIATCSFVLDETTTTSLLTRCYPAYRTGVNDILLTAVGAALHSSFGLDKVLINMEGHGREDIGAGTDITRTVGWFTSAYPVLLNIGKKDDTQLLIEVKETLHRVPDKGIGYGVLRYLKAKEYSSNPSVTFNYLGDFGSGIETDEGKKLFEFSADYQGRKIDGAMQRDSLLDITVLLAEGRLQLSIDYSNNQYQASTIENMLANCRQTLVKLIDKLSSQEQTYLTPVDLTYKALSVEQVFKLSSRYGIEDVYSLSPLQEGLYYHWLGSPGTSAYFIQTSYRLKGKLNKDLLEKSYHALVSRHGILRTVFTNEFGNDPLQVIKKEFNGGFVYMNIPDEPAVVEEHKQADFAKGFDLNTDCMMRLAVLDPGNGELEFIWSHHHIIMDGWCAGVLIKEFFQLYNGFLQAKPAELGKAYPYSDYITWLTKIDKDRSLQYWKEYLSGYDSISAIPQAKKNVNPGEYAAKKTIRLERQVREAVSKLCTRLSVTENSFIQVAWAILLGRYNNASDIVFGSVVSGRPAWLDGVEEMIGLFSNTVPVRIKINEESSVTDLLQQVQQSSIEGSDHHYIQLAEIQSLSEPGQNLFDHILLFENYPVHKIVEKGAGSIEGLSVLSSGELYGRINYDFVVTIHPGEEITIRFDYNSSMYDEDQMIQMQEHLLTIISQLVLDATIEVGKIEMLGAAEKHKLLFLFNDSVRNYPPGKTITGLFEEQAARIPDSISVVYNGVYLTYRQLDERANQLANYLKDYYHIQANDRVGIMMSRSEKMLIAILGVLKAGAAYVPVDPDYPEARKKFIFDDTGINLLLTQADYIFNLEYYTGNVFAIDVQLDGLETSVKSCEVVPRQDDLAYIIYTSGSTGEPKGVMIIHGGIVNTIFSQQEIFGVHQGDRNLQFASLSFDASVSEIFVCLASGGSLYIIDEDEKKDASLLEEYITKNKIDIATIPPAYLQLLDIGKISTLKTLVTAGETAIRNKVAAFTSFGNYLNAYGPTESSICATAFRVEKGSSISHENVPIGRPVANTHIYILDKCCRLMPASLTGEIYIAGAGLAKGYWNRDVLSREKFVDNPFAPGERMYRTGDMGKWLTDGNIEFAGRSDDQVKLNGYRIEPGELENILLGDPAIKEAVVAIKENRTGSKDLVAYYVPGENVSGEEAIKLKEHIRDILSARAPFYMMPAHFVQLNKLPLNTSGKVDRKKLPDPQSLDRARNTDHIMPRNDTEKKLVAIWSEVLGIDAKEISVLDNFFDLGGHSLKVTRLAGRVHKEFEAKVELKDLFTAVVLEDQARLIEQTRPTTFAPIVPVKPQDDYELSSSQRRLWILSRFAESNAAYNAPGAYVFEGRLDRSALSHAFNALIERHEILRTVFRENEQGEIRQFIQASGETGFNISFHDLRGVENIAQKIKENLRQEFVKPFDLAAGPLIRASLYQAGEDKWVLCYVIHHIISDAWSMNVLIKELFRIYEAYTQGQTDPLPPLTIQYKDYAAWQQEQSVSEAMKEHKEYWLKQFEGELPVLELPVDRKRPAIKTYNGAAVRKTWNVDISKGVTQLTRDSDVTLFMSLLTGVYTLLYRYTGQKDIIVGTTIAGRQHADLENQIGFYINTLPLRIGVTGEDTYKDVLEKIRQVTLQAYQHQAYPFDELVDQLHLQRDLGRNPLFDVLVEIQNDDTNESGNSFSEGVRAFSYDENEEELISKFDLRFIFNTGSSGISAVIEYNTNLYDRDTIIRMGDHLENLFHEIVYHSDQPLNRLSYLDAEEQHRLVNLFNDTPGDYSNGKTVLSIFRQQAKNNPGSIAVEYNGTTLSYRELDEKSGQLAHYLRNNYHIDSKDIVGIMMDRSEKLIIAILGILKSGAAYVPIETDYPAARKKYIIQDTGIKVLLSQTNYIFELDYYEGSVIAIDVQLDEITQAGSWSVFEPDTDSLAYVIYTSGSTGLPKGCSLTHGNLSNYIQWANEYYFGGSLKADFGLFTSLCFDLTITSIFCSLTQGRRLLVYGQHEEITSILQHSFSNESGITSIKLTPSHIRLLKQLVAGSSMECVIIGGEEVTREHVSILKNINPAIRIFNEYGPTEATVGCIVKELEENGDVFIGKPISGAFVYILDDAGALCPVGITGEIYVSGAGIAREYLNKPHLTAEKFSNDPFRPGQRMYSTGDRGRWLADGNIEFFGRKDEQVKIRGYRIETGEIEAVLQSHPIIGSAAVITRVNKRSEKELVAYVTGKEKLNTEIIRTLISGQLPAYMLPDHFVQLDTLPLTPNGKIDKKNLPDPEGLTMDTGTVYVAARNDVEEKLVQLWQEVLNKEKIGVKDNFFESGGNSLSAIRLASQVNKLFSIAVSLNDIFSHPDIEMLGNIIRAEKWIANSKSSKKENRNIVEV